MPLGIERLNTRKTPPNPNIVFIKPLPGPTQDAAQEFLERIAAQCVPVMRKHRLYVMSLEEYEPNREFVGRNFNAGEVVQLVLKSPQTGYWLPFEYVQMVMMHELAHCKQMNHSRAFWAVRNGYAAEMHALWLQGYTGDGIWGRGARLGTGEWERKTASADEVLPEHLCGGTFRSRGKKRKRKPVLTYQERKERRIRKRFGESGVALGADEDTKARLEQGKRTKAKPRVANSDRGRQLRAAAALARFGQVKSEDATETGTTIIKKEEEEDGDGSRIIIDSDSESDGEDGDEQAPELDFKDAVDIDGRRLVDSKGRGLVKVCEDEDGNDADARGELDELRTAFRRGGMRGGGGNESKSHSNGNDKSNKSNNKSNDKSNDKSACSNNGRSSSSSSKAHGRAQGPPSLPLPPQSDLKKRRASTTATAASTDSSGRPGRGASQGALSATATAAQARSQARSQTRARAGTEPQDNSKKETGKDGDSGSGKCAACSFVNGRTAATCGVCGNVLDASKTGGSWRCDAATCARSAYVNAGDSGCCGLCGRRRVDVGGGR